MYFLNKGEATYADRMYDQAQTAVADQRVQADGAIDLIILKLRFALRNFNAPSQRRIMRTYGAAYDYLDGEAHDDGDATAA